MAKKILVSHIDPITSEEDILSLFEEFGSVESVLLREEPDAGKDTYTAEIEMDYEDEAETAVEELNGEQIDGRWLYVRFIDQDIQKEKDTTLLEDLEEENQGDSFELIQKKRRLKG